MTKPIEATDPTRDAASREGFAADLERATPACSP